MSCNTLLRMALGVALLLPAIAHGHTPEASAGGAKLRFEQTEWNFGEVERRGGNVTKEFVFVNDGSAPLVVTGVSMSCSCVAADFTRRPVPAGGKGYVRLTYEPRKGEPGVFYKVVKVHSNSTDGVHRLTVGGTMVDSRK